MLDTIIIKKILLKLFYIKDNRLELNSLYFMDKELVELFKRLSDE
jgi:hypothetical protein